VKRLSLLLVLVFAACSRKPASESANNNSWFREIAQETGLKFEHVNGATGRYYMPEIMGAGCALLDYDGDGDLDVLLVQSGSLDNPRGASGSSLFRNELIPSGKLHFVDVTTQAGLAFPVYGMGAATGDFNNDGKVDLLLTGYVSNVLYRNTGNGTFQDVTAESPAVALPGTWSSSASFFDYDRDGWQDLVVLGYMDFTLAANKQCYEPGGLVDYCAPKTYRPLWAHLFHNEKGRFVEVTSKAGLDRALGRGLGVVAFDANGDGWLDLFVANDGSANHLWINQKNGTFAERALESGVAFGADGLAKAGMGVAAGDYDNDGDDDILVLNLLREGATLFRNEGKGSFTDASLVTGLHALTMPYTGFGAGWFDFDNDGWIDLFLANGAVTLREEQRGQPFPFKEKNLLLRNPGAKDRKFEDVSLRSSKFFESLAVARGAAFGDIDNDGDIDVLVTANNGPVRLLRNDLPARKWVVFDVQGPGLGIGARIEVRAKGLPPLWKRVHTDSSYLSASDPRPHFGLGTAEAIEQVRVHWLDGRVEQLGRVTPNSVQKLNITK
jgi:hypothetical protein